MTFPEIKTATHVSEASGHWYARDGTQVLQVAKADGKGMTACTLRHARKLDLARGVTSYLKLVDKPGLTLWRCRQAIASALTLPKRSEESEGEWLARVETDMEETGKKAAEKGTSIHAAIQQHLGGEPCHPSLWPTVDAVMQRLEGLGGGWRSEVGVAHPLGYGTKLDLVSDTHLLDLKSKDGDQKALDALELYEEHEMQLVAGMMAVRAGFTPAAEDIVRDERTLGIVFVSRTHPGACALRWLTDPVRIDRAWRMFQALLAYGQAKDDHRPFQN